jgi:hypothetical protein
MSDSDVTVNETNISNDAEQAARAPRGSKRDVIEPSDEKSALALEFVQNVIEDMEMDCEVLLKNPGPDSPDEISIEIVGRDSGRISSSPTASPTDRVKTSATSSWTRRDTAVVATAISHPWRAS